MMYELKCTECGIEGYSDEASSIVCQPCHKELQAESAQRLALLKEASVWINADDTARIIHKKRFNEFLVDLAEEMAEYVKHE